MTENLSLKQLREEIDCKWEEHWATWESFMSAIYYSSIFGIFAAIIVGMIIRE